MSNPQINNLWPRFLSQDLSAAEEAELVAALRTDSTLRDRALADSEMDGLLRSLGQSSRPNEEDRFVAAVLQTLEQADLIDPQPPVVDNPSQPTGMTTAYSSVGTSLGLRVAWSVVAGLAACLLVALTFINRGNRDEQLAGSDPQSSVNVATDSVQALQANQPNLAESDSHIRLAA